MPAEPEPQTLRHADRDLALERLPAVENPTLRAWSAADEHLLRAWDTDPDARSAETRVKKKRTPVLVVGDAFGALTCALAAEGAPTIHWTDSYLAAECARRNLARNELSAEQIEWVPSTADPHALKGSARTVLLPIPKSLALFEYALEWMKPRISGSTRVLCAGMTKHLSPHVRAILTERLGPTDVSPVYKKSVVFTSYPEFFETDEAALTPEWFSVPGTSARAYAFPGVFGGDRLDNGTRLLLAHLPTPGPDARVVDLGCGCGVLGMSMVLREPRLEMILTDESHLSIASAKLTFQQNGLRASEFRVADGVEGVEAGSLDCVVSNPPFHAGHTVSAEDAIRHFEPVRDALKPGGVFVVVGAHGVEYARDLGRVFGPVTRVASDRRYTVFSCKRADAAR